MRNADGSGETLFVLGDASQPSASADGISLALRRWKRDSRGIVAMDLAGPVLGANYRRLTDQSFVEDSLPAFSPDGNTIVFSSRRESDRQSRIDSTDARGGQDRALQQDFHPILGTTPSWLKDSRIVYTNCGGTSCGGLMTMRL